MTDITYVSLFSGIEAFSVAASRIEGVRWHPVFFSEIEPFPCAVLAHRFPAVPNLGDICKIRVDREKGTITNGTATIPIPGTGIDILAGGSPCQDVSVAGKRAGMEAGSGTRSSLAFEYARLVEELRPRILLWENVPGVLSSNRGLDFAAFLNSLVERGYSLAWRVLDAQYARVDGFPLAVPQRRRRVWLVGCLGADESVAAQILFERPCVLGDSPPRRAQGQGSASPPGYRAQEHDRVVGGAGGDDPNGEVAAPLCAADGKGKNGMDICGKVAVVPSDCLTPGHPQTHRVYRADGAAYTLNAGERSGQDQRAILVESASFVSGDHKASCDGGDVSNTLPSTTGGFKPGAVAVAQQGAYLVRVATFENHGQDSRVKQIDVSDTRSRKDGTGGNNLPLVVVGADGYNQTETGNVSKTPGAASTDYHHVPLVCTEPSVCKTLSAEGFDGMPDIQKDNGMPVIAVRTAQTGAGGSGISPECSHTLDLANGQAVAIGVDSYNQTATPELMHALHSHDGLDNQPKVAIGFKAGQSANGGLGDEREVAPTLSSQPSALEPTVAVGFDANLSYNPVYDDDADTLAVSHRVGVATMLKVRCGKDTYVKPDGSIGTAWKGPLASEESAFTLSATQDQTLILNHIVRRLTPTECERLQGFPDGWTLIPYRGKSADQCPDSPRYKALGNSWATNCAEWILRRIVAAIRLGIIERD